MCETHAYLEIMPVCLHSVPQEFDLSGGKLSRKQSQSVVGFFEIAQGVLKNIAALALILTGKTWNSITA